MPGESLVQVTSGAGPKLHTWQRTIGANNVEDEAVYPAEFPIASYSVYWDNVSCATVNDHIIQVMAGASLNVRVRHVYIEQNSNATAVQRVSFQLLRLTTAGTGGTAVTPGRYDTADAAAGATAMTLPTVKGTESTILRQSILIARQALSATQTQPEEAIEWTQLPGMKPFIIPAGAANGLAIKSTVAAAGVTCNGYIEFVETSFL